MRSYALTAFKAITFAFLGIASQNASSNTDFDAIDPHIKTLHSIPWDTPSTRYVIRVIVADYGFEHVSSVTVIQWIAENEGQPSLVASTTVSELSNGFWAFRVTSLTLDSAWPTIVFNATNTYALFTTHFVIRLTRVGQYMMSQNQVE